jgi:hypothetical protein
MPEAQEIRFNCPINRKARPKGGFAADSVIERAERRNAACRNGNNARHTGHKTRQNGN